jgi:pyruvate dehydrogenase E1 component alpha subunit/2-oxoisovalerate dehydrogenase E1 component alpha subunit
MAKAWGPSGGRDLNIHFGDMERGFIGPISHLGDMIPVMTGILLGGRLQKKRFHLRLLTSATEV